MNSIYDNLPLRSGTKNRGADATHPPSTPGAQGVKTSKHSNVKMDGFE